MFNNPFVFYGRIRRQEFWISLLIFYVILGFIIAQSKEHHKSYYLFALFPLFWFRYAQGTKRCHDLGNSGWYQLIPFYIFWLLLDDSNIGRNQYGDNPKDQSYLDYPGSFDGKQPFDQSGQQ